jgi:hypothetical protein
VEQLILVNGTLLKECSKINLEIRNIRFIFGGSLKLKIMDFTEYKDSVKSLEEKLEWDKTELMKQFVRENNPYKVGDIITDHIGSLKIEKMGYAWGFSGSMPCATYFGLEINKDGTPNKKGKQRTAHQSNILHN